jgi:eukaryotic-like serine/threonine-protein kinase
MVELLRGRQLGTYQIVSRLGAGGMGEVYRAKDLSLGREVAIKVLPEGLTADPRRLARFKREARVLAALNHPHIAAIYDLEEAGDSCFLVLELVEGETLARRIARGPLPIDKCLAIALQIGEAVDAAHVKGIVHRDLKPSNVILQRAGRRRESARSDTTVSRHHRADDVSVKVLDFGLAKTSAALSESPTVTMGGTGRAVILGTTAYMSPEQARGQVVDKRTDIWSLGIMLYEMVAGRVPFVADETHAVLYAIIHSPFEPLTTLRVGVPPELDRIVGKALSKSPDERYQHIDELLVDVRQLAKHLQSPTTAPTSAQMTVPRRVRRRWVIGAVAILLLVLAAGVISTLTRTRAPTELPPLRRFSMQLGNVRPVISPNGRHIAFRRDGSLWIRDLESETPREIPGGKAVGDYYSDSGYYLTWSADSQELVFPAENELRRVSIVHGGTAKTICALPAGSETGRRVAGLAWSRDGRTIVFSRYGAGVYEVPAGGGSPTLLWKHAHADDLILFDTPQGRAIVYATTNAAGHVLLVRTPDGQSREIARLDTSWPELMYSPTGHILYRRNPTESPSIWALPFSSLTLEASGEPFLLERTGLGISLAAEGTLVYLDFGRDLGQFLAWRDRRGNVLTQAEEGHDMIQSLSLSPSGERAVSIARDGGRQSLWLYDVRRLVRTRVDLGSEAEGKAVLGGMWLGEGNDVYYTLLTLPSTYHAWTRSVDGLGTAHMLPLPEPEVLKVVTDRTADGEYLIVAQAREPNGLVGLRLWRRTAADRPSEVIDFSRNSQAEVYGVLSPNERYLAYTSDVSGRTEIYVRPFPIGPGRWQVSTNGASAPVWGPAGDELFFETDNQLMRVAVTTTGRFSSSEEAEPLFRHAPLRVVQAPAPRYAVSRDGSRFLTVEHRTEFRDPVVRVVENWLPEFRRTLERSQHESR